MVVFATQPYRVAVFFRVVLPFQTHVRIVLDMLVEGRALLAGHVRYSMHTQIVTDATRYPVLTKHMRNDNYLRSNLLLNLHLVDHFTDADYVEFVGDGEGMAEPFAAELRVLRVVVHLDSVFRLVVGSVERGEVRRVESVVEPNRMHWGIHFSNFQPVLPDDFLHVHCDEEAERFAEKMHFEEDSDPERVLLEHIRDEVT